MITVKNQATNSIHAVRLVTPVSDLHLREYSRLWLPDFHFEASAIAARLEVLGHCTDERLLAEISANNLGDMDWNWAELAADGGQTGNAQTFAAIIDGKLEGFLIYENLTNASRHPERNGKGLIYVERLTVAPWNRKPPKAVKRYAGLGSAMLYCTIEASFELGYEGRIGLHSLPGAEGFYAGIGMTCYGPDSGAEGLKYFELSSEKAAELIS